MRLLLLLLEAVVGEAAGFAAVGAGVVVAAGVPLAPQPIDETETTRASNKPAIRLKGIPGHILLTSN